MISLNALKGEITYCSGKTWAKITPRKKKHLHGDANQRIRSMPQAKVFFALPLGWYKRRGDQRYTNQQTHDHNRSPSLEWAVKLWANATKPEQPTCKSDRNKLG